MLEDYKTTVSATGDTEPISSPRGEDGVVPLDSPRDPSSPGRSLSPPKAAQSAASHWLHRERVSIDVHAQLGLPRDAPLPAAYDGDLPGSGEKLLNMLYVRTFIIFCSLLNLSNISFVALLSFSCCDLRK